MSAIYPNYAPAWCAAKDNTAFTALVRAYETFQAAIDEEYVTNMEVLRDLTLVCTPEDPPTDAEITMITSPLTLVSRKANDRAAQALNTMKAQATTAFKGNPDSASVAAALDGFKDVIERFGRNTMMIESAGEVEVSACTATETVSIASEALGAQVTAGIEANNAYLMGTVLVDTILADTNASCANVRVVPPISPSQMRKKTDSGTRTIEDGGARLTVPKRLDVGQRAVKLPVTVTDPQAGYGSMTVRRGTKPIAATGGHIRGSFGLWLTVPARTKPGKAAVTFTSAQGTAKATVRFT